MATHAASDMPDDPAVLSDEWRRAHVQIILLNYRQQLFQNEVALKTNIDPEHEDFRQVCQLKIESLQRSIDALLAEYGSLLSADDRQW